MTNPKPVKKSKSGDKKTDKRSATKLTKVAPLIRYPIVG